MALQCILMKLCIFTKFGMVKCKRVLGIQKPVSNLNFNKIEFLKFDSNTKGKQTPPARGAAFKFQLCIDT